jgi:hypothetical protein
MSNRVVRLMTVSVRIRPADKLRLDALRREIEARTSRKISQIDFLSWLLDLGEKHLDELA